MGDLLRSAIREETDLGREIKRTVESGQLVSDDLVMALIAPRANPNGYVFDGFPRSVEQAERGRREIAEPADAVPDVVIYLDVADDVVVDRLLARAAIEGRADDNEETIRHRMQVFKEHTAPRHRTLRAAGKATSLRRLRQPG